MLQMINGINYFPPSRDRHTDISVARHVAIDVFNAMRAKIANHYLGKNGPGDPEVQFIFGGYSSRSQDFKIWTLHYDAHIDHFTFRPARSWKGQERSRSSRSTKVISWIGDAPAVEEAKQLLVNKLRSAEKLTNGGFDMEPFEVLRDIIRSKNHESVGGAPQLAKVYRSSQTQQFAIKWPDSEGSYYAAGREEMPYEHFALPSLDPDTPRVHSRTARHRDMSAQLEALDDGSL
ncbi:hypothetical protein QFZ62_001843 [Clavibacter sp. B3I6]|uniref:hypothetical protein n=1 Tax=Clavibacter sp. B3I6 TaxID=3042268 RepID=UPI00278A11CC|nr:hypothetical protein [Clavibacter sp. B3I6]MDQ0744535.1 hypothetical protein [Clavibacter sp. B3I6]